MSFCRRKSTLLWSVAGAIALIAGGAGGEGPSSRTSLLLSDAAGPTALAADGDRHVRIMVHPEWTGQQAGEISVSGVDGSDIETKAQDLGNCEFLLHVRGDKTVLRVTMGDLEGEVPLTLDPDGDARVDVYLGADGTIRADLTGADRLTVAANAGTGVAEGPLPCDLIDCQNYALDNASQSNDTAFRSADDFTVGMDGAINALCWWGAYLPQSGSPDNFTVTFYDDAGGWPGAVIGGPYTSPLGGLFVNGPVDTGQLVAGVAPIWEYSATIAPGTPVSADTCYWIEVKNDPDDPATAWFWMWSHDANDMVVVDAGPDGYGPEDIASGNDFAWCLDLGPVSSCETEPPTVDNDDCQDAICIADGDVVTGTTFGATGEDITSCALNDVNDVWFVTSYQGGPMTVSLCGSLFDTTLALFDGCEGNELACNDDLCGLQSEITYDGAPGDIWIRISGYNGGVGSYTLSVIGGGGTCSFLPCEEVEENCQIFTTDNASQSNDTAFRSADDFVTAMGGDITDVCWWGAYLPTMAGDNFTVTYYDNSGSIPGAVIGGPFSGGALAVTGPVDTGQLVAGVAPIWEYAGAHAPVTVAPAECYWIEIKNNTDDPGVNWFWEWSFDGNLTTVVDAGPDGYDPGDVSEGNDFAWCLNLMLADLEPCLPDPPPNDLCDDAIFVGVPSNTLGTTIGATFDDVGTCGTTNTAPGVWYAVEGTGNTMTASFCPVFASDCCFSNGSPGCDDMACQDAVCAVDAFCCDTTWDGVCADMAADLCGDLCGTAGGGSATYDTKLSVFCRDCGDLQCVDGNDDACGLSSEVTWCSQAGITYLVLVHGFGSGTGDFDLFVGDDGMPCEPDVICTDAGACCFCDEDNNLACADVLSVEECDALEGVFFEGESCSGGFVGYTVEPGGMFADITGDPMAIEAPTASNVDDGGDVVPLGFSFNFYGNMYTEIGVCSNGYLTFGPDLSDFSNDPIPTTFDPNDLIAPYWDDWSPNQGGTVHYLADGASFVAQWTEVPHFQGTGTSTFQAVLTPDGCIEYRYADLSPNSPTVGIENIDGTDGIDSTGMEPAGILYCPQFTEPPNCEEVITCIAELPADIKPGSCPNSWNRGSNGVLPVAVLGTMDVDAADIDATTVVISRADGFGGSVGPNFGPPGPSPHIDDVASPFDGELCGCHEEGGDGIPDLMMHFRTQEVVAALDMGDFPGGAMVELVISGTLMDGTPFEARDCVRLVPPNSAPAMQSLRPVVSDLPTGTGTGTGR